jgi:ABC-type multidrug transport system fused ATPase/permease subunit
VSLSIPAGTFVALVGASGSGKTSIVSLLLRFYDPTGGSVALDGAPLRSLPLAWARAQMAWVQQEGALFADSIMYNMCFPAGAAGEGAPAGAPAEPPWPAPPPPAAVRAAAAAAHAGDFIGALPHAFATHCGPRGSALSGGQKQRVCIARAVLRDAPILLLDEATSALDSASEKAVQAALDAMLEAGRGRTALVIAHRLSTVRRADKVLVLGPGGALLEEGSFDALASRPGGIFARMVREQGGEGWGAAKAE